MFDREGLIADFREALGEEPYSVEDTLQLFEDANARPGPQSSKSLQSSR